MKCRHCQTDLEHLFLDLGFAPPSNAYVSAERLNQPETTFPLRVRVCDQCWLVQTEDYAGSDELFQADYAYFSSTSKSWLKHATDYVEMITKRLNLGPDSFVIELASNDGYLLKNFVAAGIPCLGIEPTSGTAAAAEALGIPVVREFFGSKLALQLAQDGKKADLIIGNNVFAHVPDINDFTLGIKSALLPNGTTTLEFPHLLQLIENGQFDTVYHEHYSYLSLHTVTRIFASEGLRVFDVEELPTHGGSLRIYGCHAEDPRYETLTVNAILQREKDGDLLDIAGYSGFQKRAENVKDQLLMFLIEQKKQGKKVVAYGAAAKGNTLLNFAGVKPDLLTFVCDAAPSKQGKFLPGSHIPVCEPDVLDTAEYDFVLVLAWNLVDEITEQLKKNLKSKTTFVTAVPELRFW